MATRLEILDMLRRGELDTAEADGLLEALEQPARRSTRKDDALPARCPSCRAPMVITQAQCSQCPVTLDGAFTPCPFCCLEDEQAHLLRLFLSTRGNLREMGRSLSLSYPTVRSRLEDLLFTLGLVDARNLSPLAVIRALRDGKVSVDEATKLLRSSKDRRRRG